MLVILSIGLSWGRHRAECHASRTLTREGSERKEEDEASVYVGLASPDKGEELGGSTGVWG